MQWKPMKEYQAPAYLAKAATLLAATALLNGCGNPSHQLTHRNSAQPPRLHRPQRNKPQPQ